MKERSIPFTYGIPEILDSRKTQTRRVITPQPIRHPKKKYWDLNIRKGQWFTWQDGLNLSRDLIEYCPYGKVGDRLWVKETLRESSVGSNDTHKAGYAANLPINDKPDLRFHDAAVKRDGKMVDWWDLWRKRDPSKKPPETCSSRFMPRWASRIILEITDIRVERVQEININDAIAEGIEYECDDKGFRWYKWYGKFFEKNGQLTKDPINSYKTLWDKFNAKRGYGWDINPWVWVITFKQIGQDNDRSRV